MMKMYIETDGVHLKRHVMFIINDQDVHRNWWSTPKRHVMFIINDQDVHRNWWSTPKKTCNVHYQWWRCT